MCLRGRVSLFQATLKADSTTKTLPQRCHDLVKIIDECPAKVAVTDHTRFSFRMVSLMVLFLSSSLFTPSSCSSSSGTALGLPLAGGDCVREPGWGPVWLEPAPPASQEPRLHCGDGIPKAQVGGQAIRQASKQAERQCSKHLYGPPVAP